MFPKVSNPFPQNPDTFCPGWGFSHLHPLLLQVQLDTLHFVQSSGWSQKIIFWLWAFSLIMFHVNWHPVLKDNSLNFSPDFIKQTLLSSNILYFHPKLPYSFRRYFILGACFKRSWLAKFDNFMAQRFPDWWINYQIDWSIGWLISQ